MDLARQRRSLNPATMHESILAYRRMRYLWVASRSRLAAIVAYAWHDPPEPPNGGTWLGYTLGDDRRRC